MKPVFADTGFFLALINPRDQYHRSAAALNIQLRSPLVTTAWVLLEFANAISASRVRGKFEQMLVRLQSEPDAKIIGPQQGLFDEGCRLYTSRGDKEWSLTDCISFVAMEREGATEALTADRHFEQAGFRTLLRT
jgi:predicted nucleic acid-binding protein